MERHEEERGVDRKKVVRKMHRRRSV